jgi:U3 small nucleolar RNA-associated protein 13
MNSVLKVHFINQATQLISSGSDGLLKLWNVKTYECIATWDAHTDKIWSLCASQDDVYLVSGGADSLIQFWQDYSEQEEQQQHADNELRLLSEQKLSNYLLCKDYKNAIMMAMSLQHPFRLFSIFNDMLVEHSSDTMIHITREIVTSLTKEQVLALLTYIRDWNTHAKSCFIAQSLLKILFQCFPPAYFLEDRSIHPLLEALIPYTERHFQRANQLLTQSFIVDYTLQNMDLLLQPPPSLSEEYNNNPHQ